MSNKSYRFDLDRDDQITNLEESKHGEWKRERVSSNEAYQLVGDNLIKTKTKNGRSRTQTFADPDKDGIYTRVERDPITGEASRSPSQTRNHEGSDGYRFTPNKDGQVTNLQEYEDGQWKYEDRDSDETWSFNGKDLIKTEVKRYGMEVSTYSDGDGDQLFTKVSERFVPFPTFTSEFGT